MADKKKSDKKVKPLSNKLKKDARFGAETTAGMTIVPATKHKK